MDTNFKPAHVLRASTLTAEWHNAAAVCRPGFACWVASVEDGHRIVDVAEHDDEESARAWAAAELRRRTGEEPRTVHS